MRDGTRTSYGKDKNMKAAIYTDRFKYVLDRTRPGLEFYNFSISPDRVSFVRVFHSAFSTPARYVMEAFRRLMPIGDPDGIFVFNPLFEFAHGDVQMLAPIITRLREGRVATVISDHNNIPAGYF